jgi:hypothetical protein
MGAATGAASAAPTSVADRRSTNGHLTEPLLDGSVSPAEVTAVHSTEGVGDGRRCIDPPRAGSEDVA